MSRPVHDGVRRLSSYTPAPEQTPTRKKLLAILMFLTELGAGIFISLLSPFYPRVAEVKGLDATGIGIVIGIFELCGSVFSPLFGKSLSHIGSKFLYLAGALSAGVTSILFGFVEDVEAGTPFVAISIAVRVFQGISIAAYVTATYTIMSHAFPNNVAAMFALLETLNTVGWLIGPPIGGVLYTAAGFKTPFIVVGVLLIIASLCVSPLLPKTEIKQEAVEASMLRYLSRPIVLFMLYITFIGSAMIGLQNATLSLFLESEFHLDETITGVVFLAGPAFYAISAPIWGRLGDVKPKAAHMCIIAGYLVCGLSHFFMGPAPFLPVPRKQLWLLVVSLFVFGVGLSPMVLAFPDLLRTAKNLGYPESQATNGIVSGLFNSAYHFGGFVGPVAGGALMDAVKFPWTMVIGGITVALSGLLLLVFNVINRFCNSEQATHESTEEERQPLTAASKEAESKPLC